jgi:hypothetical protein
MVETNCDFYDHKISKKTIYSLNNGYIARLQQKGEIPDKDIHATLKKIDHGIDRFASFYFEYDDNSPEFINQTKREELMRFFDTDDFSHIVIYKTLNRVDSRCLTKIQYRYLRDSLVVMHKNKIIHGDLPENVMIDPDDQMPRIIGWKHSKKCDNYDDMMTGIEIDMNAFFTHYKVGKKM